MAVATQKAVTPKPRRIVIDHGIDLENLHLPLLPPGPYISSSAMGSDNGEILDEAPENMRREKIVIDLVDIDSDDEIADLNDDGENNVDDMLIDIGTGVAIAGSSRNGNTGKGKDMPNNARRLPNGSRVEVVIPVDRAENASAGPSRPRPARPPPPPPDIPRRDLTMSVAFGDEPAMEVPLGWGGLGIPAVPKRTARRVQHQNRPTVGYGEGSDSESEIKPAKKPRREPLRHSSPSPPPPLLAVAAEPPPPPVVTPQSPPRDPAPAPAPWVAHFPSDHLPAILEILPDICLVWARDRVAAEMKLGHADPAVRVVQAAFEVDGGYPKAEKIATGSSKVDPKKVEENFRSREYMKAERSGPKYEEKSVNLLAEVLSMVPLPHVRSVFRDNASLLIPAYFALEAESKTNNLPYIPLKAGRSTKGKGKATLLYAAYLDEEAEPGNPFLLRKRTMYDKERKWLTDHLRREAEANDAEKAKEMAKAEALANGGGMECGCCFGEESLNDMFQCSEGHLFCGECTKMHIETKLGEQKHVIACMDTSSCPALFPESEVARVLPQKSLILYHRLKQANELESAGIDGLETCPNCPFSAIIENPHEKLFTCQAPDCGVISCRKCRKVEHLPKTCEEMEADRKLDKRHAVEDAMSEALIRRCPKCEKPFIKDTGCNKITCTKCGTFSCYICRKVITNGYAHFNQNPANYALPKDQSKCMLWDPTGVNEANEILAARNAAQEEARIAAAAEGVALLEADINVEAPIARVEPGHAAAHAQALQYQARLQNMPRRGLPGAIEPEHFGRIPIPAVVFPPLPDRGRPIIRPRAPPGMAAARRGLPQPVPPPPPPIAPRPFLDLDQYRLDIEEQQRMLAALRAQPDGLRNYVPPARIGGGIAVAAERARQAINRPLVPPAPYVVQGHAERVEQALAARNDRDAREAQVLADRQWAEEQLQVREEVRQRELARLVELRAAAAAVVAPPRAPPRVPAAPKKKRSKAGE